MGAREELLAAARSLEDRGITVFPPAQLIREARSAGSTYPETTLRTLIVGPMCLNSPDHHAVQYGDLERVERGLYRLVSSSDSPATVTRSRGPQAFLPPGRGSPGPPQDGSRGHEELTTVNVDVEANVKRYLAGRSPSDRYSSFDYCFNYFRSHRESGRVEALLDPGQVQTSCLQIGFFLASWGMFRGRAEVLTRSVKCFEPVVETIVAAPAKAWDIDADTYTDEALDILLEVGGELGRALPGGRSAILVTKTMLGVFGCVPAFDRFFRVGLGVSTFGRKSLRTIGRFYTANAELIERYRVPTLDFSTAEPTDRLYTRAKVIDMVFFVQGAGLGPTPSTSR